MAPTKAPPCTASLPPPRKPRSFSPLSTLSSPRRRGPISRALSMEHDGRNLSTCGGYGSPPARGRQLSLECTPAHHLLVITLAFCPDMVAPVPVFVLHQGQSTGGNQCQS